MKAYILLENGTILEGKSFGAQGAIMGEIVFNTGMTGYQEILTDPSYAEQIVVMTYPLIGNYGVNKEDVESSKIQASGLIVRGVSEISSNFKSEQNLDEYLKDNGIIGIQQIDTRRLTKIIRSFGTMKCLITTNEITKADKQSLNDYSFPKDHVERVSIKETVVIKGSGRKIGVVDLGVKDGIIKHLTKLNCEVHIFPHDVDGDILLNSGLDAVLLSNGPGDPKNVVKTIETAKKLFGKIPMFGICLGVQILALALGGDTYKLKFGHRGSNHPVIDTRTNKVTITAQNHGYAVDAASLKDKAEITHLNINDETVEGFSVAALNIHAVQFHPEAGPGPTDANYIFSEWIELLDIKETQ